MIDKCFLDIYNIAYKLEYVHRTKNVRVQAMGKVLQQEKESSVKESRGRPQMGVLK